MTTARSEFLAGIKAELPILVGALPFGLIYGVAAVQAGVSPALAQAMSALVFAGSAQFIVAQLIGGGTPAAILILTALIVNLRHALYSISLAPHLVGLALRWKMLLAYLLTDEAYAVTIIHYDQSAADPAHKHWYFLGAGLALWLPWQLSTAVGIFLSAQVPAAWSLDITLALTFIALLVPTLKDRPSSAAAASAGAAAVLARNLPLKLGLVTATLIGIGVGVGVERLLAAKQARRQPPAQPDEQAGLE